MASHNSYVAYKRDTRHFLYWMIHASNSIIKTLPTDIEDGLSPSLNTSGQTTVTGLVAMAELVGKYTKPIPTAILQLLRSIIVARSAHHAEFQHFATKNPGADVEKSNATHRFFIDALIKAFKALSGNDWTFSQKPDADLREIEEVVFNNQFSALNVEEEEDQDSSDEAGIPPTAHRRTQRKPGKGKKGKKGKKTRSKTKPQRASQSKQTNLDDVPLESYRIIEDEEGITTDYLMAVYSIAKEWADLRNYLQGIWHDVAYRGLNSAVAGTMSNLAIGMVKQTELDIFAEFPGHESYETVMKTITRGDINKAQGMFTVALHVQSPSGTTHKLEETNIDIKEHILINAYDDLVDFIEDFQKNRTGKPTKAMMAEIGNWDPNFDLKRAAREQRLKWRRSYTINWLYDLVNVFSGVVMQRIRVKGERHVLENIDWSAHGPWSQHRVIFGLNDFAAIVTKLAMQKPGTDIRKKILPHHVFQLQLIIDAFTVSRGWTFNVLRGHVLEAPAKGFRPRRDVDKFLDRNNEKDFGFLRSVEILEQLLKEDGEMNGDPSRHARYSEILHGLQLDFIDWLGESKYMYGLNQIPPSRFSNSNANGLWEYSPFLCGVGLMEGLELSYRAAMWLWEGLPDPTMLIHLHNMLVQKGYIKQPVGLYSSLQDIFPEGFFVNGRVPKSDFHIALADRMMTATRRRSPPQPSAYQEPGIHSLLDVRANRNFSKKSNLLLYREAGWNLDRIPDSELEPVSVFGMIRISQTKQIVDPVTGKKQFEETDLVRRLKAQGIPEDEVINMINQLAKMKKSDQMELAKARSILDPLEDGYKFFPDEPSKKNSTDRDGLGIKLTASDMLECVKTDIYNDICGDRPLSALNYLFVTIRFSMQFSQFEKELSRLRNPLYVQAYETNQWKKAKRMGLVTLAMAEQEDECLRVMAEQFQNPRSGFMNFIYWDDLVPVSKMMKSRWSQPEDPTNSFGCSIM